MTVHGKPAGKRTPIREAAEPARLVGARAKSMRHVGSAEATDSELAARSKLARALYRRSVGQFRASLAAMSMDEMLSAVEAKTPAETIVRVISSAPDAGLPAESAWTRALARGAERKQELIERAGGCLLPVEVARRLEISPQAVKQRIERRALLGVRTSGGRWGIPARQFGPDGEVRAGIAQVLKSAPDVDAWVILSLLVEPDPASKGRLMMERLDERDVLRGMVERLRTYGEHSAA
ncbi:MAG: hypothetical protein JWM27_2610 [Gemmatimonadetes bacterium]|nr:hypothetical protein [Gemmatimonadota bacterium]